MRGFRLSRSGVLVAFVGLTGCSVFAPGTVKYSPSLRTITSDASKAEFHAAVRNLNAARDRVSKAPEGAVRAQEYDAFKEQAKTVDDILQQKFDEVIDGCNSVIGGMQLRTEQQERDAFMLAMSGLVTGSVLGPAAVAANPVAHRAAIAAFSGWAGATNFAGQSLRTAGLAGDAVAKDRNQLATQFADAVAKVSQADDPDARWLAIEKVRATCVAYTIFIPGAQPAMPAASGASGAKGG